MNKAYLERAEDVATTLGAWMALAAGGRPRPPRSCLTRRALPMARKLAATMRNRYAVRSASSARLPRVSRVALAIGRIGTSNASSPRQGPSSRSVSGRAQPPGSFIAADGGGGARARLRDDDEVGTWPPRRAPRAARAERPRVGAGVVAIRRLAPAGAARVGRAHLAAKRRRRQHDARLGEGPVPFFGDGRPERAVGVRLARGDDFRERRGPTPALSTKDCGPADAQGGSSPEDAPPVADDAAARQGGDGLAPAYYDRDALAGGQTALWSNVPRPYRRFGKDSLPAPVYLTASRNSGGLLLVEKRTAPSLIINGFGPGRYNG